MSSQASAEAPTTLGEGAAPTEPVFSVVIPTYNRPDLCRIAVESVVDQTFADWECIVVDNASDQLPDLPGDPRIRVIRHERNRGAAAARNTGAAAATGRYVAFLDDDDRYAPQRLERALEAHRRAPIVTCWARHLGTPAVPGPNLEGDVSSTVLEGMAPHCGATSIERQRFQSFDESYTASEDIEWWIRQARAGTVTTIPSWDYLMLKHDRPRTTNSKTNRLRENMRCWTRSARTSRRDPGPTPFVCSDRAFSPSRSATSDERGSRSRRASPSGRPHAPPATSSA
jgi:glycosyltransferase involved in cell wall biosynthesis